jgi:Dyp-type peroxidase family
LGERDLTMPARDELDDIPALVWSGFGRLRGAAYLLLRVVESGPARNWLRAQHVASASDVKTGHLSQALQIAFTARGLHALGFADEALASFAPEFLDGMAGDSHRSRRLGDTGPNAPSLWRWGAGESEPDIILLLYAAPDAIDRWSSGLATAASLQGLKVIERLLSIVPNAPGPRREPFGFVDGISQPEFDWDGRVDVNAASNRDYRNIIAAGEVLLGHPNEYGFVAEFPNTSGLGRNGTYLVFREIKQEVDRFWQAMTAQGGEGKAVWLAEHCVGRTLDGDPLPGLARLSGNDFRFSEDPDGMICPIGSHIRRANPRSGDDPNGNRSPLSNLLSTLGFRGTAPHDAVASARFHRILRRGRPYGQLRAAGDILGGMEAQGSCGLYFICLNASLARQFEFVQGAWLASTAFAGLTGEQDSILGNRKDSPTTDAFRYVDEDGEPRLWPQMPRFTQVEGGAYFFLPGMRGLRVILGETQDELKGGRDAI